MTTSEFRKYIDPLIDDLIKLNTMAKMAHYLIEELDWGGEIVHDNWEDVTMSFCNTDLSLVISINPYMGCGYIEILDNENEDNDYRVDFDLTIV